MVKAPYQQIKDHLSLDIPSELIKDLPRKWEKIGKILVFKLPSSLNPYKEIITGVLFEDIYGTVSGVLGNPFHHMAAV